MKSTDPSQQIVRIFSDSLSVALTSMTGKDFSVSVERKTDLADAGQAIIWQQAFSFGEEPALWLVAGQDLWTSAGRLTLEAAGIEEVAEDDCRSTWREILGQTMGGFAAGLTADLQSEITVTRGEENALEPQETPWTVFTVRYDDEHVWFVRLAWSRRLAALYEPQEPAQKAVASRDSAVSKTFDLLLDVALPVSVSFGKTSLQVREVLKLNTGSIVELNRFVVEPVEVIVNDCVIARGEVVVVDGNYGVRITHLASREERLRSGMSEHAARIGASPR